MDIREHVSLRPKTTMRIGGTARYYADVHTKKDLEEAWRFAQEQHIPLFPLGGGSNTIFADGTIDALVIRLQASSVHIEGTTVTVETGKNLPQLINELAKQGLDLSPLTGILGTVGGAIFGNAGQGPQGIWMNQYIQSVDTWTENTWKTYKNDACQFGYRDSIFKHLQPKPVLWSTTLSLPQRNSEDIQQSIEQLLKRRIEAQPHIKTAGSCFKAVGNTPAWQLIDAAGLRSVAHGDVHVSEKHANFLINNGNGSFTDAVSVVEHIQKGVGEQLDVEMQFVQENGAILFT